MLLLRCSVKCRLMEQWLLGEGRCLQSPQNLRLRASGLITAEGRKGPITTMVMLYIFYHNKKNRY